MHQALFFKKLQDDKVVCGLCPHNCNINPGEHGVCGTRFNHRGQLISANYGKVTALHPDPIEKKPLYHFFPGSIILSVGSFGCNLRCDFCQNHHISQESHAIFSEYRDVHPEEILQMAIEIEGNIGLAYTYNEPVIWYEFMADMARLMKENNMKNVMVSNGFVNPGPLKELCELIDAFSIDLKSFDPGFYTSVTGSELAPVLKTLKTIVARNKHLEITFLVIPGLNDKPEPFLEMIKWIKNELGQHIPFHISRYFPHHKRKTPPTPIETLYHFYDTAKQHLSFVYLGNVAAYGGVTDTHCPGCGVTVVERGGYTSGLKNADSQGRCRRCQHQIFINR
jgi:pyruvate formate lyase activating enzyme